MEFKCSEVEMVHVDGFDIYLKRDDLLHPTFSGNKARKLYHLLNCDLSGIDKLVGFGSAQANSLYALAALAKMRGKPLDYYVDHIPSLLTESPAGNYRSALELGANVIAVGQQIGEGQTLEDYVVNEIMPGQTRYHLVPEGGRYRDAAVGIYRLADEIIQWAEDNNIKALTVMLPSGTGTTALYLKKRLVERQLPFDVLSCACVGGDDYLKSQFDRLEPDGRFHPVIGHLGKKYHFGKLYPEFYRTWLSVYEQTSIEFDLLYDPLGWLVLLDYLSKKPLQGTVMYVHQGGVPGNETMLPRYRRKYP